MKQKRKTEVVSPVLMRDLDTIYDTLGSYYKTPEGNNWYAARSLLSLFEDPGIYVRMHVVPHPSKWTVTMTIRPNKFFADDGMYIRCRDFLLEAQRTLKGHDHGNVHFWLENL
jgi:hypothetical protein